MYDEQNERCEHMTKAKTIDRLELTRKKFSWLKDMDKVPAANGVEDLPPEPDVKGDICPMCGKSALIHESGCVKCLACSWSKCG